MTDYLSDRSVSKIIIRLLWQTIALGDSVHHCLHLVPKILAIFKESIDQDDMQAMALHPDHLLRLAFLHSK